MHLNTNNLVRISTYAKKYLKTETGEPASESYARKLIREGKINVIEIDRVKFIDVTKSKR